MAVAAPPQGATNAELVRWSFQILNEREVEPLHRLWTNATVERFPSRSPRRARTSSCTGS